MRDSRQLEADAAAHIAGLMAVAARTAPKTRGIDNVRVVAVDDPASRERLCATMQEIARRENRPGLARDARSIAAAPAVLVIGVAPDPAGLDCGFCGHGSCDGLRAAGGVCAFNSVDLGIAACSAAATASQLRADCRVMYSIGYAALELKLLGGEVRQALGIPVSITGKSPFFDRGA
ncbi:MAG TPA: DUF2148 domain-containing protein [Gemmatimonadales bacterium]|nr:DUF2148 domain-containing protein [Gemmatimonadales bacterium]